MTDLSELETQIKSIDERTAGIEQTLSTLATKDDVHEEGERTRRHIDAFAEQMRRQIALMVEEQKALTTSVSMKRRP